MADVQKTPVKVRRYTIQKQPKLHVNGRVISYQRSQHRQHTNHMLLRLEGVRSIEEARFYCGKRVAYLYSATNPSGKKYAGKRVIWGKITATHGNSGCVRAKFATNLPGQALGKPVRVFLFPSNI